MLNQKLNLMLIVMLCVQQLATTTISYISSNIIVTIWAIMFNIQETITTKWYAWWCDCHAKENCPENCVSTAFIFQSSAATIIAVWAWCQDYWFFTNIHTNFLNACNLKRIEIKVVFNISAFLSDVI